MERRLFYTSPFDHTTLEGWDDLARSLEAAVAASCERDVSVRPSPRQTITAWPARP